MKDKEFLIKIGLNIKEERLKKGLKQVELAALLNMEDSSLRRIENGRTNTTLLMLKKIANALEISVSDLLKNIS